MSTPLTNTDLLADLDNLLLEVEQRLANYGAAATTSLEAADEGLVLACRVRARLMQTDRLAGVAKRQLETVGVGDWSPLPGLGDPRLLD